MYTSILTVASLCAVAFASPEYVQKRQAGGASISSILAEISSLQAQLQPPASIASELTGIPASVTSALNDPSAIASLESAFIANGPPAWYASLAPDAQAYILQLGTKAESILPEIASLEVAAGLITASGIAGTAPASFGAASTGTGMARPGSNSTVSSAALTATSKSGSATATGAGSGASSSAAKSSSSSGGAAQPTGAIAAGVLAAGSFLGLALAL